MTPCLFSGTSHAIDIRLHYLRFPNAVHVQQSFKSKSYIWGLFVLKTNQLSHLMRLWHFSSSVNSFFKRACAAIQWLWMSDVWSDLRLLPYFMCANSEGSGETARMRRLTWAFVSAQTRQSLRWSPMWWVSWSHELAQFISVRAKFVRPSIRSYTVCEVRSLTLYVEKIKK